jgi:hypothetical protein
MIVELSDQFGHLVERIRHYFAYYLFMLSIIVRTMRPFLMTAINLPVSFHFHLNVQSGYIPEFDSQF